VIIECRNYTTASQ